MKKISILGSTGSVGTSTLKLVEAMPGAFEVVLLAANRSREALRDQIARFTPPYAAIGSKEDAAWLRERVGATEVLDSKGLLTLLPRLGVDVTVSAIVGAAGLKPTLAAIESGSDLALANKESMVVAGDFVNAAAKRSGTRILPVDSEHNALHQCLRGEKVNEVKRLILTASGGPFRTFDGDFSTITRAQALDHPTWDMGPKITIDSATMMNKGLEVIEAHHLFGFPPGRIDIAVHPQSIIHSMIETVDGSFKCQLSKTDMCDPIQYALTWPERKPNPFETLDLSKGLTLELFPADRVRFPCIQLAYDALEAGGAAPAVLNAANEVAVAGFLEERIAFTDIPRINRACLDRLGHREAGDLDALIALDDETRTVARNLVKA